MVQVITLNENKRIVWGSFIDINELKKFVQYLVDGVKETSIDDFILYEPETGKCAKMAHFAKEKWGIRKRTLEERLKNE